jgi:hypothetical protein
MSYYWPVTIPVQLTRTVPTSRVFSSQGVNFVLQKLMVALISSAVAFGSVGTAAAAQGGPAKPAQSSTTKAPAQATRNATPLPPGGAAGIQRAQGANSNDWILIGGGIAIAAGILFLVAGGGDDDSSPTTGSN